MKAVNGKKLCAKCNEIKEVKKFRSNLTSSDGFRGQCKTCEKATRGKRYAANPEFHRKQVKDWRERNPEKVKERRRKAYVGKCRFRVASETSRNVAKRRGHQPCNATIEELKAAFDGKCHICGVPEAECNRRLSLDHCHKTGKFRGWLCGECNRMIGCAKDSIKRLESAKKYLQQTRKR